MIFSLVNDRITIIKYLFTLERMPVEIQHASYQRPAIEFKSSTFTVPALILTSNNLTTITEQLKIKLKQAPEFFKQSPLLIDLQELTAKKLEFDLDALIPVVRNFDLIPIGIRGGTEAQNRVAFENNMAVLSNIRTSTPASPKKILPEAPPSSQQEESPASTKTKLITQPIRSGQRIYAKNDLIILAQVSAGAEVMAEGNIHIYGTLRGRALAGVQGDVDCSIFCSDLQAELISIAGNYRISEDLDESVRGKPVQIQLKDQAILINEI
jgi:septum site-determining protein MinC